MANGGRADIHPAGYHPVGLEQVSINLFVRPVAKPIFEGRSNDIALIVEPILTSGQVENVRHATEALGGTVRTCLDASAWCSAVPTVVQAAASRANHRASYSA